ncbi:MAG: hypothetical protein K0U41_06710 [Gammaproteobacteria bacterium]|nr:hypothetical protein [Gammaproteobacteria bacterium]
MAWTSKRQLRKQLKELSLQVAHLKEGKIMFENAYTHERKKHYETRDKLQWMTQERNNWMSICKKFNLLTNRK